MESRVGSGKEEIWGQKRLQSLPKSIMGLNKNTLTIALLLSGIISFMGCATRPSPGEGCLPTLVVYFESRGIRGEPPHGIPSFSKVEHFTKILNGMLLQSLTSSSARKKVAVLERDPKYLHRIIEEERLQRADLVKKSIAIGRHERAQYVVGTEVEYKGSMFSADTRLINCSTLRIEVAEYLSCAENDKGSKKVKDFIEVLTKRILKAVK